MVTIMRKLQKIFGLLRNNQKHNLDERGFVFLELMIGLPLIVILLWSMNSLFTNSLYKCKYMVADFILQQEMESAMARIVEVAKVAYKAEILSDGSSVRFYYYKLDKFIDISKIDDENDESTHDRYIYLFKDGKMYRGVKSGATNPITGDSWLADTNVTSFKCIQKNPKLLYIKLEATSTVSEHNIVLTTEVYMRGSPP